LIERAAPPSDISRVFRECVAARQSCRELSSPTPAWPRGVKWKQPFRRSGPLRLYRVQFLCGHTHARRAQGPGWRTHCSLDMETLNDILPCTALQPPLFKFYKKTPYFTTLLVRTNGKKQIKPCCVCGVCASAWSGVVRWCVPTRDALAVNGKRYSKNRVQLGREAVFLRAYSQHIN
jgi:hypothetical protein